MTGETPSFNPQEEAWFKKGDTKYNKLPDKPANELAGITDKEIDGVVDQIAETDEEADFFKKAA
jgi:hypothetical protein